ncbi:hypothetical protein RUM43_010596, partial [Polyplax serrata]
REKLGGASQCDRQAHAAFFQVGKSPGDSNRRQLLSFLIGGAINSGFLIGRIYVKDGRSPVHGELAVLVESSSSCSGCIRLLTASLETCTPLVRGPCGFKRFNFWFFDSR